MEVLTQLLAGHRHGGNTLNLPAFQLLSLCPRLLHINARSAAKTCLKKFIQVMNFIIVSFKESIKIYLLTVFSEPVVFLNFRKMVGRLILDG